MRVLGVVVVWLALAAAALAAAPRAAAAGSPCRRFAAAPQRVPSGDDTMPDVIHGAAGAVSCPDDVWVQVTACLQLQSATGWDDLGCASSPRTHITPYTRGGRGQGVSFDVPCASGTVRTHVTGGEGLDPPEWDSVTAAIACSVHDGAVDTTPPVASIVSGPAGLTRDASPAFGFTSSEAGSTFECRLDAPGWSACTSPVSYASLADGEHTFRVRATDPAGNLGAEATRIFTVDTAAPVTPIDPGPAPDVPRTGSVPEPARTGVAVAAVVLPVAVLDATAPRLAIAAHRRALSASRAGLARVRLGTLDEDASGTLELRAGGIVLGRAPFTARAGRAIVVRVPLSRKGFAALRRRSRLAVRAAVTVRDAAGNASATAFGFTLEAP